MADGVGPAGTAAAAAAPDAVDSTSISSVKDLIGKWGTISQQSAAKRQAAAKPAGSAASTPAASAQSYRRARSVSNAMNFRSEGGSAVAAPPAAAAPAGGARPPLPAGARPPKPGAAASAEAPVASPAPAPAPAAPAQAATAAPAEPAAPAPAPAPAPADDWGDFVGGDFSDGKAFAGDFVPGFEDAPASQGIPLLRMQNGAVLLESQEDVAAVLLTLVYEAFFNPATGFWATYDSNFDRDQFVREATAGTGEAGHARAVEQRKKDEVRAVMATEFSAHLVRDVVAAFESKGNPVEDDDVWAAVNSHVATHLDQLLRNELQ
eukprot:TRINITY_DN557_c0_g2_i1.p1 TRINITY_DN557_c0_g2~~TRINITY_DN557_c0_g2_i1.p1  ORF type:complete len:330 (+),score=101.84 TRINITY_DN557_c0_g2_i1:28-990(+)